MHGGGLSLILNLLKFEIRWHRSTSGFSVLLFPLPQSSKKRQLASMSSVMLLVLMWSIHCCHPKYGNKFAVHCWCITIFNIMGDLSIQIWHYVSNICQIESPFSILWLIYVVEYSNTSAIYCKFTAIFDIMGCVSSNTKYGEP